MRCCHLAFTALIVASEACGGTRSHDGPTALAGRRNSAQDVIGRWALVSLERNGVDQTGRIGTNGGAVRYYTFNADGTFRIALGDSVTETGTWSEDTTVSPKVFDHTPDVNGKPGPYVPGIFAIDADTLKISLIPPNPARRHPTEFRSAAADSSWLLVFRRAGQ